MPITRHVLGTFAASTMLALAAPAVAADIPPPPLEPIPPPTITSPWSVTIAPYLWAAGLDGEMGLFGLPSIDVDESFIDILETLDFGYMAVTEIRYGRFGLYTDLMYARTSDASGDPDGVLATRGELNTESLTFTAAGEYRFLETPNVALDAMVGARVWWVDNEIGLSGGLLGTVTADDGDTWVDPVIGMRGRANFTERWFMNGWAMVGGFGVSSDFMWDVMGGVGYDFNRTFSAALGYRALGVDYSNDGFVYDVIQHGPITGVIIRF